MEYLLDQGADVFAVDKNQRRSAIHYAVVNGHTNVLKSLLSDNAKVHTEDGQVPLRDVRIHDMSGQCRCAPTHIVRAFAVAPFAAQQASCPGLQAQQTSTRCLLSQTMAIIGLCAQHDSPHRGSLPMATPAV